MKFKTNAMCSGCVAKIGKKMNQLVKAEEWSIDLNDSNRTLTVNAEVSAQAVIDAVKSAGYKIEQLS